MFNNKIVKSFIVGIGLVIGTLSFSAEYTVSPGSFIGEKVKLLKPGDKLYIKAGIYNESITISNLNGTKESPILIKGEKGVEIQPTGEDGILFYGGVSSYIIVEGIKIENASRAGILTSSGSHHITIKNCILGNNGKWGFQSTLSDYITVENYELYGSRKEHGIYFATTDHPVARGNKVHDNGDCGIHMNGDKSEGGDGMITGALIENNIIYNNNRRRGGGAINMDGVEYSIIRNNLLYNNKSGGITHYCIDGAHMGAGVEIYNNTIYFQPKEGRWSLIVRSGAKNTVIKNNIFHGGRYSAMGVEKGAREGLVSDYNIFYTHPGQNLIGDADEGIKSTFEDWQKESSQDSHSVSLDPLFVNIDGADFHLKKDSPGVNTGVTIKNVGVDLEGKKRPTGKSYDIGAYEQ